MKYLLTITLQNFRWLLEIGDGKHPTDCNGNITLPEQICLSKTDDLVTEIFGKTINPGNAEELSKSAILCPTNAESLMINDKVLDRLGGKIMETNKYAKNLINKLRHNFQSFTEISIVNTSLKWISKSG